MIPVFVLRDGEGALAQLVRSNNRSDACVSPTSIFFSFTRYSCKKYVMGVSVLDPTHQLYRVCGPFGRPGKHGAKNRHQRRSTTTCSLCISSAMPPRTVER